MRNSSSSAALIKSTSWWPPLTLFGGFLLVKRFIVMEITQSLILRTLIRIVVRSKGVTGLEQNGGRDSAPIIPSAGSEWSD